MRTMARGLRWAMVAAMLLACVGCQNAQKLRVGDDASAQEAIVLQWMVVGTRSAQTNKTIEQFNEVLHRIYPDTTVEFEIIPYGGYKKKWDLKMATNQRVDIAWTSSDLMNYAEEVKKGSFFALDYLIQTVGADMLQLVAPNAWKSQQREGKTYGIPIGSPWQRPDYAIVTNKAFADASPAFANIGLVNRQSLYTNQACYDAIEVYLRDLQEQKFINTGVSCATFAKIADKGYEGIYGSNSPFVIKIFDLTPTVYNKYALPEYKTYFQTMDRWYKQGYIRQDISEVLDVYADDKKANGSSIFLDENTSVGRGYNVTPTQYESVRVAVQDYVYLPYESGRNVMVIPKTCRYPKRAMEVLNLMCTDEGASMFGEFSQSLRLQQRNAGGQLHQQAPPLPQSTDEQANANIVISPLVGFELNTRMIVLELQKIKLVVNRYLQDLRYGTCVDWEQSYQELIEKMQLAGSDKVIAQMQKQIDVFLK